MCARRRAPLPHRQRQRLGPRRWQTDRQQIVSETPFGDREHTHDRWDSGSIRVIWAREEGQLERCARVSWRNGSKVEPKANKFKECMHVCMYVWVCALPQIAFVGSILDVVTDVVVHSVSCCAVSSIKNLGRVQHIFSTFYCESHHTIHN